MTPLRILFTEATSLSARQSLYALGPRWTDRKCEIDVMDPSALSQCRYSSLVRRWYRCPHYAREPEAFLRFLSERLRQGDYDVLLPTHEQTILLSRYRDRLGERVGLALPHFESVATMQDKAKFMRWLLRHGFPIPATQFVRSRREVEQAITFPCYLKQAHSTAGAGVFRLDNRKAAEQVLDRLDELNLMSGETEWLIQQPAVGVMSTVKAVFDTGRLVGCGMYEARMQGFGGMSTARRSVVHDVVFSHIAEIGQSLAWHGGMFLDYFHDPETGKVQYLEGNPRIGETFNPTLCGMNLVERWVQVSLGQRLPTFQPAEPSASDASILTKMSSGVRTQSFYMVLISMAHAGATRRQMFKQLLDYLFGRSAYADSQDELTRPHEDTLSLLPSLWIAVQVLTLPSRSRRIVQSTIQNYALPESEFYKLDGLAIDVL